MKASELLREAAAVMEWREHRTGCCEAIMTADKTGEPGEETLILALEYLDLFRPKPRATWWFGGLTPANQKVRVLGLLFAAEIAEADGQ